MGSCVNIYNAEMPILRDLFKMAAHEAHVKAERLKSKNNFTSFEKLCWVVLLSYSVDAVAVKNTSHRSKQQL